MIKAKFHVLGPLGDYHVGHQSIASLLAQDIGGLLGHSMLLSKPSPTQYYTLAVHAQHMQW